ncbi:glycosyltransferase [Rhodococcus sp. NBC_00294]|uniref:glycosyltransferase n=1 Tax=Rhodococcus sp. NBC_00294 TaxID=2976004 RepID=UPI002E28281E|nr:glycosyltransferase [Rhodococcus sp. NBC_00294]
MRILHVTEAYGGGIQTAIASYIRNSPAGIRHSIIARGRSGHETNTDLGCPVRLVTGGLREFFKSVSVEIAALQPTVVHLHSSYAGIFRLFAPRGVTVVHTPHAFAFLRLDVRRMSRLAYLIIEILLARKVDVIAAISPFEYKLAKRLAPRRAQVRYLPNVASPTSSVPQLDSAAQAGGMDIITIGRITAQKDPQFVAEVARHLSQGWRWVWVGDGDVESKEVLRSAGIQVTGWLPNAEVISLLQGAALYVHGAAWEGAPLTLLEAVANGIPVIARDVPTLGGLGFPTGGADAEDMADAIERFFVDDAESVRVRSICDMSMRVHSEEVQREALRDLYMGDAFDVRSCQSYNDVSSASMTVAWGADSRDR